MRLNPKFCVNTVQQCKNRNYKYILKRLNPKFCVNTVQQCKNRNYKYILKQAAAAFGVAALVTS